MKTTKRERDDELLKAGPAGKAAGAGKPAGGGTEVAPVVKGGALATMDFAADAGMGMEGADKDSFAIPFFAILQGLSPQCDSDTGVEGAKPGLLINTVTNEIYNKGARVIPVTFQRKFLRWAPRSSGGGFKGELQVSAVEQLIKDGKAAEIPDDKGKKRLMYDGDLIRDTRVHYVLVERGDKTGWVPMVMSLASTQIKESRRWMSIINSIQKKLPDGRVFSPPSFSHTYNAETKKRTNDQGTWYAWDISLDAEITDVNLYQSCKDFHKQIVSGKVVVKHEDHAGTDEDTPVAPGGTGF